VESMIRVSLLSFLTILSPLMACAQSSDAGRKPPVLRGTGSQMVDARAEETAANAVNRDAGPTLVTIPTIVMDRDGRYVANLRKEVELARMLVESLAATFEPEWLARAAATTEVMLERFWDDAEGGFFDSPADANGVRVRLKDGFDGAELAGNSVAAEELVRLGALLERDDWRERAERSIAFHARWLASAPWAMPRMVAAMERAANGPRHIVIAGERDRDDTRALIAVFESRLRPDADLVVVDAANRAGLSRLAPFAALLPMRNDRATAYVCRDRACELPVHEPAELAARLDT